MPMRPLALAAALLIALLAAGHGVSPPPARAAPADREALEQMLEQGSAEERRKALLGLATLGDPDAVPAVADALRDPDAVVRELAEQTLWAIWMRSGDQGVDTLLQRGTRLMARGRLGRAVAVFDEVIERAPQFAEGYNKRATAYYHLGEYEQSLDDIAETLARNPYHFGALSGAGLCMIGLERYRQAIYYFQRALEINPNLDNIRDLKGRLERKVGGRMI